MRSTESSGRGVFQRAVVPGCRAALRRRAVTSSPPPLDAAQQLLIWPHSCRHSPAYRRNGVFTGRLRNNGLMLKRRVKNVIDAEAVENWPRRVVPRLDPSRRGFYHCFELHCLQRHFHIALGNLLIQELTGAAFGRLRIGIRLELRLTLAADAAESSRLLVAGDADFPELAGRVAC